MKPAWSAAFDPERLKATPVMALPSPMTREWAWGGSTGAGVKVAVVDSGVDGDHPVVGRLAGAVAFEADGRDGARAAAGAHADLVGHGTAAAGIIRRAAPDAELYSVRVLGAQLTGKGRVFAAGLRWAIDHGMHVVNLSLSTKRAEHFGLFHELADAAYFKGAMLVCAVNNVPAPSYPSQYASVFSVAACGLTDPWRWLCNPEPPVEFGAPGIDVEVAWLGGGTVRATGNSFAAPHLAGVMARILGKHPALSPAELKAVLRALADNAAPTAHI